MGNRKKLAKTLEKLIPLCNEKSGYLIKLAKVYRSLKQNDKALDTYSRGLDLYPKNKEIQKGLLDLIAKSTASE